MCLLGRDEGKQAASAETQSHRKGRSERLAGKSNRENEMSGREIGGRKGFEGMTLKLRDYRKSQGKGKKRVNW